MAILITRPESPYYFVAWTAANGRRLKKSTKTTIRKDAQKICNEYQDLEDKGRTGRLTVAHARRVVSEIAERFTGETLQFYTARGWLDEWLAGKMGATSARTQMKYEQVVTEFLKSLGGRADRPLEGVTPTDVRGFRDKLAADGHSPATVNGTVRKILSAAFAAACRHGFISTNPCAAVEELIDEGGEREPFTVEQIGKLLGVADNGWKGMILGGYYTGLRLKDLSDLLWESVNLEEGQIRLMPSKTKKKKKWVVIPIATELIDWLTAQPRGIGKAPVFPSLYGKSGGGKSGLSMRFKRIMERAGVQGNIVRKGKGQGRTTSSLSFHSLRHTFNTQMANAGVAQELRQKLTGHASARMNDKYTHHDLKVLRSAVDMVPPLAAKDSV